MRRKVKPKMAQKNPKSPDNLDDLRGLALEVAQQGLRALQGVAEEVASENGAEAGALLTLALKIGADLVNDLARGKITANEAKIAFDGLFDGLESAVVRISRNSLRQLIFSVSEIIKTVLPPLIKAVTGLSLG